MPWHGIGVAGGGGPIGPSKGGIYTGGQIIFVDPSHPGAVDDLDTTTPFVTISQALTAATADGMTTASPRHFLIAPKAGGYVENISLPAGANLVGLGANNSAVALDIPVSITTVLIDGLVTPTTVAGDRSSMSNIVVKPTAATTRALRLTGTSGFFSSWNCLFVGKGAAGVEIDVAGTYNFFGGAILRDDTAAAALIVGSGGVGAAGLWLRSTVIYSGSSVTGTALTANSTSNVYLRDCQVRGPMDINSGGTVFAYNGTTLQGNSAPGAADGQAVADVAAGGVLHLYDPTLMTDTDPLVTGAGTVVLAGTSRDRLGGQLASTLTVTLMPTVVGALGVGLYSPDEAGTMVLKRHAAYPNSQRITGTFGGTTADATPTALDLVAAGGGVPLQDNSVYILIVHTQGRDTAGTHRIRHSQIAMIYRQAAGAATLGPADPSNLGYSSSDGTMGAVIGVSGNTGILTVTGRAATNMVWTGWWELQAASTAS